MRCKRYFSAVFTNCDSRLAKGRELVWTRAYLTVVSMSDRFEDIDDPTEQELLESRQKELSLRGPKESEAIDSSKEGLPIEGDSSRIRTKNKI